MFLLRDKIANIVEVELTTGHIPGLALAQVDGVFDPCLILIERRCRNLLIPLVHVYILIQYEDENLLESGSIVRANPAR